jgi:hypothetical protein
MRPTPEWPAIRAAVNGVGTSGMLRPAPAVVRRRLGRTPNEARCERGRRHTPRSTEPPGNAQ